MTSFTDYTPRTINDIVFGSDAGRKTILDIVNGNVPFPTAGMNGILLYGVYGTGKTTLTRLLPQAVENINGSGDADIFQVSVNQGNDGAKVIANIAERSLRTPIFGRYHHFVLDEVDLLKGGTMASLKSAMNAPNTVFVMTTNNLSDVDKGVQNRCKLVELNAAAPDRWLPLAKRILSDRGVTIPPDARLIEVISRADGSARTILNDMQDLATRLPPADQQDAA